MSARRDRRDLGGPKTMQVELALDHGRKLLEGLPYPADLDNHFVVDPAKFDFYAMDCYRTVGEDGLAEVYACEVIRSSTDFNGFERKPMRIAEALVTLAVAAARAGDLSQAVNLGQQALSGDLIRGTTTAVDRRRPADLVAACLSGVVYPFGGLDARQPGCYYGYSVSSIVDLEEL